MLFIKNYQNLSEIVFENYTKYAEKSAFSVVKLMCESCLFSYESRRKAIKKFLNIKTRTPIYFNEKTLLIPTKSPRNYEAIWFNYFKILKVINLNKTVEIVFKNLTVLKLDVSYYIINKGLANAKKIITYLEEKQQRLFLENSY